MDYFIWDKKSNLLGLSANTLFNSRPDLKYDDVIVIHKKGEPENIVMVETKNELKATYDIKSDNADVVGFVTAIILAEDDAETIEEKLNNIESKKPAPQPKEEFNELTKEDEDVLFEYARLLEDIINRPGYINVEDDEQFNTPISESYKDPECDIVDLSDADDDVYEAKLNIVLKHAFISELADITKMRCMQEFNEEIRELCDTREKYANESDMDMVEITTNKIEAKLSEITDSCDATLSISVDKIYKYDDVVIADCCNGQTMIIQKAVINSMRTNSFAYSKSIDGTEERNRMYYKTVSIVLDECYNEVIERDNTIFVIAI
jgi:hypothetical protein